MKIALIPNRICSAAALALLAAASAGCDGGTATGSTSGGGEGGSKTTTTTAGTATTTGTGGQGGGTTGAGCPSDYGPAAYTGSFVLHHINFGEFGPDGCPDPTFSGWKYLGENLDGQDGVNGKNCALLPNAKPDTLEDGEGGIDNAFGHFAIPIASNYVQLSGGTNSGFAEGAATLVFALDKLDQAKSGDSVAMQIYVTAPLVDADAMPHPPKLDGTDVYSADDSWLVGDASKITAMAMYKDGELQAEVDLLPIPFSVKIGSTRYGHFVLVHKAHLAMPLSEDHSRIEKAGIAGFVDPTEFFDAIQTITGTYLQELCTNATVLGIKDQIVASADIRTDTQADIECNALSFGIELDAVAAGISGKTSLPPLKNPCTM
jgi:hypothetical protein